MPAPWSPDPNKDGPLQQLAGKFTADTMPNCETAWHLVNGDTGFNGSDGASPYDDLCYVRFNWMTAVQATGALAQKESAKHPAKAHSAEKK